MAPSKSKGEASRRSRLFSRVLEGSRCPGQDTACPFGCSPPLCRGLQILPAVSRARWERSESLAMSSSCARVIGFTRTSRAARRATTRGPRCRSGGPRGTGADAGGDAPGGGACGMDCVRDVDCMAFCCWALDFRSSEPDDGARTRRVCRASRPLHPVRAGALEIPTCLRVELSHLVGARVGFHAPCVVPEERFAIPDQRIAVPDERGMFPDERSTVPDPRIVFPTERIVGRDERIVGLDERLMEPTRRIVGRHERLIEPTRRTVARDERCCVREERGVARDERSVYRMKR